MYQVATLQSLMQGYYDNVITAEDLKTHGDTGFGTFEDVNGEMIMQKAILLEYISQNI